MNYYHGSSILGLSVNTSGGERLHMPFTMTHLIIASNISHVFANQIDNLPQFFLGCIAPDAVHNRENYMSDYKKKSHLCVGPEKWGMTTNNDEWKKNVLNFYNNNKKSKNKYFVFGYVCHILADICNNIYIWTPYRLKYPDELKKGYGSSINNDYYKIDIELALTYKDRNLFWECIQKSTSIDLVEIIYASEIEAQKKNILQIWYKDKKRQDLSSNEIITYESNMDFIDLATGFILDIFQRGHPTCN